MSSYNVIIVLPGTTGTTLLGKNPINRQTCTVWPDLIAADSEFADPAIAAAALEDRGVYGKLSIGVVAAWDDHSKGYGSLVYSLLRTTKNGVGFQAVSADQTQTNWGLPSSLTQNLVVAFPYDWRQDNTVSATRLQSFLAALDSVYGSTVAQIDLIAHSMGGIVSRTYLESVGVNDSWYGKIASLTTLGTPHLGAPLAFQALNGTINFNTYIGPIVIKGITIPPGRFEKMAWDFVDNSYSDSTCELLPPPASASMPANVQSYVNFLRDDTVSPPACYSIFAALPGAKPALPAAIQSALQSAANPVSADSWTSVVGNLTAAQTLLAGLTATAYGKPPRTLPVYRCVYGLSSDYPTCTGISYQGMQKGAPVWSFTNTPNGGDQVVPQWSAAFTGGPVATTYQAPGSVNHLQLPSDGDVQSQLVTWLGLAVKPLTAATT